MIHYTCDVCRKQINSESEERFRVLIDVEQMRPGEDDSDLDNDFSGEFDAFHLGLDEAEEGDIFRSFKFDLCRNCAEIYVADPLARKLPRRLRFMDN